MKRTLILTSIAAVVALAFASTGSAWVPPPPPPTSALGGAVSGLGSASQNCTYETMSLLPVQTQFGFRVVISSTHKTESADLYIWGPDGFPIVAPAKLNKVIKHVGNLYVMSYDLHTKAKGRYSMETYLYWKASDGICLMSNTLTLQ